MSEFDEKPWRVRTEQQAAFAHRCRYSGHLFCCLRAGNLAVTATEKTMGNDAGELPVPSSLSSAYYKPL